jgi:signal-transduction protein with cAMP-binding, CBS, and nucleotidyltransferase domain
MLASVLAELVASALMRDSLMTEKLTRRGLRVQGDYEADVLSGTLVAEVMTDAVTTIPESATVGQARDLLEREDHGAAPIVDPTGACIGIVTRRDLVSPAPDPGDPVATVATGEAVTVAPDDTVLEALHRLLQEDITHLPVVEDGKLVGICTRADVLEARMRQFEREHLQPGWSIPTDWIRRHFRTGGGRWSGRRPSGDASG